MLSVAALDGADQRVGDAQNDGQQIESESIEVVRIADRSL